MAGSDFVMAGWAASANGGLVARYSGGGVVKWQRTYGGVGKDEFNAVVALANGDIGLAGVTGSKGKGGNEGWFVRLVGIGELADDRAYGTAGAEFTDMADLGVSLHPTLRTGLKLKSPDVQVSAGMVENFGVTAAPEIRAAELVVDNHWVPGVKAPAQWELAVAATGRYVFASHVAAKGDAVQTILDLYARRGALSGVPQLSLLIRAHAATNYRNEFSASTAVGVEHQRYDFALLVRCARTVDRWAGTDGASCGVVMAVAPGVLR